LEAPEARSAILLVVVFERSALKLIMSTLIAMRELRVIVTIIFVGLSLKLRWSEVGFRLHLLLLVRLVVPLYLAKVEV
jgi:hypothetical protein